MIALMYSYLEGQLTTIIAKQRGTRLNFCNIKSRRVNFQDITSILELYNACAFKKKQGSYHKVPLLFCNSLHLSAERKEKQKPNHLSSSKDLLQTGKQ